MIILPVHDCTSTTQGVFLCCQDTINPDRVSVYCMHQAIFGGRSGLSEPGGVDTKGFCKCKEGAAIRKQAEDLNHRVTHSDSHWQTQDTFKQYITEIIVPDYTAVCKQQQRVLNVQRMILQLDVYAVHRAEDIIKWLKEFHPYIVLAFVPGGCTGAVQIPDTCLNRPFKAAIHESFSKWVVAYLSAQTRNGVLPADLKMDFKIGPVSDYLGSHGG